MIVWEILVGVGKSGGETCLTRNGESSICVF